MTETHAAILLMPVLKEGLHYASEGFFRLDSITVCVFEVLPATLVQRDAGGFEWSAKCHKHGWRGLMKLAGVRISISKRLGWVRWKWRKSSGIGSSALWVNLTVVFSQTNVFCIFVVGLKKTSAARCLVFPSANKEHFAGINMVVAGEGLHRQMTTGF